MKRDLTQGSELGSMLLFSLPLIAGNLLQQLYNVVDTLIVGRFLGAEALAAVGASSALMVFLTSILLGLCMGGGAVFAQLWGARDLETLRMGIFGSFVCIGVLAVVINLLSYLLLEPLMRLLNIQPQALDQTLSYLRVIFGGILFTFLFNFVTAVLRAVGDSRTPLLYLGVAAVSNILLDLLFVVPFGWGVAGAALATVIAQGLSALLVCRHFLRRTPELRPRREERRLDRRLLGRVMGSSALTSVQQSVMNFGILMIQGLVNSFGVAVTAAFAAAAKIDAFAYMPLQDFGNAFSTYTAQNHGAGKGDRVRRGMRLAVVAAALFGALVSLGIYLAAPWLMRLFVGAGEAEIVAIGVGYLRIEGAFYPLIGWLFLLYGYWRAVGRPMMSLVLTLFSLGTRVALAYLLAPIPAIGLRGIWWAIPIGWLLADLVGFGAFLLRRRMERAAETG